jgi:hypothetical protein
MGKVVGSVHIINRINCAGTLLLPIMSEHSITLSHLMTSFLIFHCYSKDTNPKLTMLTEPTNTGIGGPKIFPGNRYR